MLIHTNTHTYTHRKCFHLPLIREATEINDYWKGRGREGKRRRTDEEKTEKGKSD